MTLCSANVCLAKLCVSRPRTFEDSPNIIDKMHGGIQLMKEDESSDEQKTRFVSAAKLSISARVGDLKPRSACRRVGKTTLDGTEQDRCSVRENVLRKVPRCSCQRADYGLAVAGCWRARRRASSGLSGLPFSSLKSLPGGRISSVVSGATTQLTACPSNSPRRRTCRF